ncbi:MAG: hypothetical protein JWO38_6771 [Gemmataceae bacterium]|nr:hypothetical protein [Gemmataceae bacterium]
MRSKLFAAAVVLVATTAARADDGLTKGTPDIKSVSALAFGPKGLLFIGDPQSATIFAVDTGDAKPAGDKAVSVERIDAKLAGVLGTTEKEIRVNDLKVNPASGNVYLAVTRGTGAGQPAIVRLTRTDAVEVVSLKEVPYAKVKLPNPAEGKGAATVVTSMAFLPEGVQVGNGRLIVAGLSNEQFASTLRAINYPFKDADKGTGIEIFHGAHGKIETHAPIRTFVAYKVGKDDTLMAAYTCTPLVKVPVADLKAGEKVKGTTIAELGNRNNPLDMIVYTKDGKDYLLVANSDRGVMKIPTDGFAAAEPITERPKTPTAGVKYETVSELKGVTQLDKLDDARAVLLVKTDAGLDLKTIPLP